MEETRNWLGGYPLLLVPKHEKVFCQVSLAFYKKVQYGGS